MTMLHASSLHERTSVAGWGLPFLLILSLLLTGCDEGELLPPQPPTSDLFARYVAVGNSITAGFQSLGINDSTQQQSYAVLVAEQMGTEFNIPSLNAPGCPPPVTNIFTSARQGGRGDDFCALRDTPVPSSLNNVAVPGAKTLDAISNFGPGTSANELTLLLLGGRTQVQAAVAADPTFVSVWLGNNDVLGAALSGVADETTITQTPAFEANYTAVLDSLNALTDVQGGVLIGVVDATLIPYLSPGVAYWQAEQQSALPPTFDVADSCAPAQLGGVGETTLVPFRYGFGTLLAQAQQGQSVTLDCAGDALVLTPQEVATVTSAVQSYNDFIQSAAEARGWAYFDPNPRFQELRAAGEIPLFPNTPPAPESVSAPFGEFFSRDGFHPAEPAHRLAADGVIAAINENYDTSIPPVSESQ